MALTAKRIFQTGGIVLLIFLILFLGHPVLLQPIGAFLITQDESQPADAVIVIGSDKTGKQVEHAVNLFRQGLGKYLIISGSDVRWRINSADIIKQHAMTLGVPREAILVDRHGTDLMVKAQHVRDIMEKEGLKRAILVSSMFGSARAIGVFRSVLAPGGMTAFSNPVAATSFGPENWWTTRKGAKTVLREYLDWAWVIPGEEE